MKTLFFSFENILLLDVYCALTLVIAHIVTSLLYTCYHSSPDMLIFHLLNTLTAECLFEPVQLHGSLGQEISAAHKKGWNASSHDSQTNVHNKSKSEVSRNSPIISSLL